MTIKELITVLSQCDPMTAIFIGRDADAPDEYSRLSVAEIGAWEAEDDGGVFTVWTVAELAEEFARDIAEDMRRQNPAIVLIGEDL